MARLIIRPYEPPPKKKRPGTHSKNASKGKTGYKKRRRGQGKRRK